jgi:hypothetical protein
MLFKLLIVCVEVTELVRKNVCIGYKVKVSLAELLLHPDHVIAKTVLSGDLVALREVIDLLVLVQALVQVALAA